MIMNEPTRKSGTRQKILVAANFVAVSLLILAGYYKAPRNSTVTSTCHTVHGGICHWSDGGYSMRMPDGAFYTREHANDPWERDRSADSPRDETTVARGRGGSKTKHKS